MMKASLNYKDIHPGFKLNGVSYGLEDLKDVAYSLIKEGKEYERIIGDFLLDWLDENSTLEVRTSGSTGKPKTILLKKQHMVNSAIATGAFFDLQEGNTALLCLPAEYIAGKMMLVRAMVLGLELDYNDPSSNPLQQAHRDYDFCAMVPLQLQNCAGEIERIKTLIVGGTPISRDLMKQVRLKSTKIYETYGMTETVTHVAVREVNNKLSVSSSGVENGFHALVNVHFSQDNRECLVITAPKITDNPVTTNDIVNLISETQFEWLGRYDNVINSGGIKLFPEQIETKLAPFLDAPFFVAGITDKELGQKLILVVEGDSKAESILNKIKENDVLERLEIPKAIFHISDFIRTDSGKIRRNETLKLLKS